MAAGTINEIKAGVETWIAQACEEAIFDTCSVFLYTLRLKHPEMDLCFFSEEAVEEVKRYAVEAIKDIEASTLLDPSEVAPPIAYTRAKVQPTEATTTLPG